MPSNRHFAWDDALGSAWEVVDFYRPSLDPRVRAQRLPIGDHRAEGRAFIPVGRDGPTMLFEFGRIAYRDTSDRTLAQQLAVAYPVGATPAERMQRR